MVATSEEVGAGSGHASEEVASMNGTKVEDVESIVALDKKNDDADSYVSPPNSLWRDMENGELPVEVSERILKRAKEMEEKRKQKKRKEAQSEVNKYPGLSFNPEIELKKWEIYEQRKQMNFERLEEGIDVFSQIADELEQENSDKRTKIDELFKFLALGSPSTVTREEEKEKMRFEVDVAKSDLKWAMQEQKRIEKELQREKERWKEETLEHQLSKRKNDRLIAECVKKKVVYTNPKPDKKLDMAENDIDDLREKRDTTESALIIPEIAPESERGRILEEREKMLHDELKTSQAMIDKLRFDIQAQRDARDAEAKITLAKEEKLALLIEDVEFYRPFYDEKFQRWVDQRLWEQPTIDEVIHPGVRHAAQEISELWQENCNWLIKKHAKEDQDLLKDELAKATENSANFGKANEVEKPEIEKHIKDANAEKSKLQHMNDMLKDFITYLEDEGKKDEEDLAPVVKNKDDQRKELEDKINECNLIIKELRYELPSAREEIEKYRSHLDEEDKRRGEKFSIPEPDEEDIIREFARKAVAEARPRNDDSAKPAIKPAPKEENEKQKEVLETEKQKGKDLESKAETESKTKESAAEKNKTEKGKSETEKQKAVSTQDKEKQKANIEQEHKAEEKQDSVSNKTGNEKQSTEADIAPKVWEPEGKGDESKNLNKNLAAEEAEEAELVDAKETENKNRFVLFKDKLKDAEESSSADQQPPNEAATKGKVREQESADAEKRGQIASVMLSGASVTVAPEKSENAVLETGKPTGKKEKNNNADGASPDQAAASESSPKADNSKSKTKKGWFR